MVQQIEREETEARERQKEEEEKMGLEAAERLVVEMSDEIRAMQLQRQEQDDHALWVAEGKIREEKDRDVARIADYDAKEQIWLEDYKREVSKGDQMCPNKQTKPHAPLPM